MNIVMHCFQISDHLKRCQNPPIPLPNVKTELSSTPPLHMSGALLAQYAAELHAAELQGLSMSDISGMPIPGQKLQPRDQESPRESSSFMEPPEKEKVQVIKNYPLNIPVPSSEMLLHGLAATAALGMTMTVPSGDSATTQTAGMISTQSIDLTSSQSVDAIASQSVYKTSSQGVDLTSQSLYETAASQGVDLTSSQSVYETSSQGVDLTSSQTVYETSSQGVDLTSSQSLDLTLPSSETACTTSTTHTLDLTTQASGVTPDVTEMEVTTESEVPTSAAEESTETPVMPTISDMRITIPATTSEVGVTDYGELPELTAMNDALSIIQSKSNAAERADGVPAESAVVVEIESADVEIESAEVVSESAEGITESVEGVLEPAEATEEMPEPAAEAMETKESDEPINLADS